MLAESSNPSGGTPSATVSRGVVITGAAGDLGGDLARSFAAGGWQVFAADVAPVAEAPGITPAQLDVVDRDAVFSLAAHAAARCNLQAWVNAAGLFKPVPVPDATIEDWNRIIAVNVTGTFNGCAAALKVFSAQGGGRIVNVGSVSGQVGGTGVHPAYGASKAAVHALTKTYALEGGRLGVLCNAVAPGLLDGAMAQAFGERQRLQLARANPLGRLGEMEEVTRVVRFLADSACSYVNGAIIPVNGGAYLFG